MFTRPQRVSSAIFGPQYLARWTCVYRCTSVAIHLHFGSEEGDSVMKLLVTICILGSSLGLHAQAKYFDKNYGVSFRYSKEFALQDYFSQDAEPSFTGIIPMEFVEPGGERVVSLHTLTDRYRDADFVTAYFGVSVNQYLTEHECMEFPAGLESGRPLVRQIGGIEFHGIHQDHTLLGDLFSGFYYHGFARSLCYELGFGIVTGREAVGEAPKKIVRVEVLSQLQRILQTVTIQAPTITRTNSPSIESFAIAPLATSNVYRVSWGINGAAVEQVWLSFRCAGVTIFEEADFITGGPPLPCEALIPLRSQEGVLDIEFWSEGREDIAEEIRVFVTGSPSVSKVLTLSLPALRSQ